VADVDAALEVMTGLPAGDPSRPDAGTVNGRVARRLAELAERGRGDGVALLRLRAAARQGARERRR
jgi:hypothetical protein